MIFAYIGLTCDQGVCMDEKTSPLILKGEVFAILQIYSHAKWLSYVPIRS